jgi:hypothetical protein
MKIGEANGIRTRVLGVKVQRPSPLDDGLMVRLRELNPISRFTAGHFDRLSYSLFRKHKAPVTLRQQGLRNFSSFWSSLYARTSPLPLITVSSCSHSCKWVKVKLILLVY